MQQTNRFGILAEDPDCQQPLSASRQELKNVLDDLDPDSAQHMAVLHNYLIDLKANIFEGPKKEDVGIIKSIESKLDDYDRHHYLVPYYGGFIQLHRAKRRFFKLKVAALNSLKSQMKAATMLDFYKSLVNLPEEAFKLKAHTLDFVKSLLDLEIPEAQKVSLLQKTKAASELTRAYNDAIWSLKRNTEEETDYIEKLKEVTGKEYQEQEEEEDSHLCSSTTDMDSLKECLKAMEVEIEKKQERVGEIYQSRHSACKPSGMVQTSIHYVSVLFGLFGLKSL